MVILWALLFGALIGWVASVAMRAATNEGILLDIAAGMLGAIPMAALLETTQLWIASSLAGSVL